MKACATAAGRWERLRPSRKPDLRFARGQLCLARLDGGAALFTISVKGAGLGGVTCNELIGELELIYRKPAPSNPARVRHPVLESSLG